MHQILKYLKIFFLITLLVGLIGFGLYVSGGKAAFAADPISQKMQVGIPEAEQGFGPGQTYTFNTKDTTPIALYIRSIYKYAIGIVGILATVVMMIGGIMWIISGGNSTAAGEAKAWISASLTGLVLTVCSYLILATVNPALTNFKISEVASVSGLGCCYSWPVTSETGVQCESSTESACTEAGKKFISDSCANVGYCSAKIACDSASYNNGEQCITSSGKQGYCVNGSSSCNPCKLGGATCGQAKDYECCSGSCNFGLEGHPTEFSCKISTGASGNW